MIVELEDGSWRVLVDSGTAYASKSDALDACSDPRRGHESEPLIAADLEAN